MVTNQLKWLRVTVVTLLVFLAIQFEFGIAITLSNPPSIPPFGFSLPSVLSALNLVGFIAVFHTVLGIILTILSVISLVMALASKIRSVQIFAVLGFLCMSLAATMGLFFVLSGFQEDNYSHGMATNFLLTFGFYFLELYFLKPASKTQVSHGHNDRV
jgi:hypothetical protein